MESGLTFLEDLIWLFEEGNENWTRWWSWSFWGNFMTNLAIKL